MTENNTTPAGAIFAVTAEDLTAHRAQLEADRAEAYRVWLNLPSGADREAGEILTQRRALISAWDEMSDAERAEIVRDARTAPEVEAEPAEPTEAQRLANALEILAERPNQNAKSTLTESARVLIELELGNEQKAEAMSNAEKTIREQGEQIRTLNNAQIEGNDFRLRDFWEKAGELAESAGYCEQYDHLAEQLGGPRRTVNYDVTHRLTVTLNVYTSSYQTASTNASSSDFDDWQNVDGYDLDEAINRAIENGDYEITDDEIEEFTETD